MFLGKLIAGLLGLIVAGIPGAFFGLVLGHLFDRGLASALGQGAVDVGDMRAKFFRTIFLLSGYVAKADGRVSEEEIAHTEQLFRQLGLGDEQRHDAILLFKAGAEAGFDHDVVIREFLQAGGAHPALKQTLMMFLLALALADRQLHSGEQEALRAIGAALGYSPRAVDELLRMATAQEQFHQHGSDPHTPTLDDAYAALGVTADSSDGEVKKAYRKLMSQNHPDKLSARGVPEDMLKIATEKSQEIQAAYELIRKSRGMSRSR